MLSICNAAARQLASFPVVAILGARQVGKTTLARQPGNNWQSPALAEGITAIPAGNHRHPGFVSGFNPDCPLAIRALQELDLSSDSNNIAQQVALLRLFFLMDYLASRAKL